MDKDTLHIKLSIVGKYQIPHATHKFAHNNNEIKHMTFYNSPHCRWIWA